MPRLTASFEYRRCITVGRISVCASVDFFCSAYVANLGSNIFESLDIYAKIAENVGEQENVQRVYGYFQSTCR